MYDHYAALIFDMDGTLVDSGPLHENAWIAMLKNYNVPVDRPFMRSLAGVPTKETIEILLRHFNLNAVASVAEMHAFKDKHVHENMRAYVKPTALSAVVKQYYGIKPMAIGTGAWTEEAKIILNICGLDVYITTIVGADQVKHPKPAPDTFLRCAELLGANPKQCVVFEDSKLGLQAAASAGMVGIDVLVSHNIENDYFL